MGKTTIRTSSWSINNTQLQKGEFNTLSSLHYHHHCISSLITFKGELHRRSHIFSKYRSMRSIDLHNGINVLNISYSFTLPVLDLLYWGYQKTKLLHKYKAPLLVDSIPIFEGSLTMTTVAQCIMENLNNESTTDTCRGVSLVSFWQSFRRPHWKYTRDHIVNPY